MARPSPGARLDEACRIREVHARLRARTAVRRRGRVGLRNLQNTSPVYSHPDRLMN
jgi:hypothetical protein